MSARERRRLFVEIVAGGRRTPARAVCAGAECCLSDDSRPVFFLAQRALDCSDWGHLGVSPAFWRNGGAFVAGGCSRECVLGASSRMVASKQIADGNPPLRLKLMPVILLSQIIPRADDLLALEPEELGLALLRASNPTAIMN